MGVPRGSHHVMMAQQLPLPVDDPAIERLSDSSTLLAEAVSVAARSFAGTTSTAPEGAMDWCHGPELRGGPLTADGLLPTPPLSSSAGRERLRWLGNFCAVNLRVAVRHGGCFALKDSDGRVVATTVAFPAGVDTRKPPPDIDPATLTTTVDKTLPALCGMLGLPTMDRATGEWREWWGGNGGSAFSARWNQLQHSAAQLGEAVEAQGDVVRGELAVSSASLPSHRHRLPGALKRPAWRCTRSVALAGLHLRRRS
jgi:hypothetical protein